MQASSHVVTVLVLSSVTTSAVGGEREALEPTRVCSSASRSPVRWHSAHRRCKLSRVHSDEFSRRPHSHSRCLRLLHTINSRTDMKYMCRTEGAAVGCVTAAVARGATVALSVHVCIIFHKDTAM